MIKLRSIKNLSKNRNHPSHKIYNLIGIKDNTIKNYVGYTANIEQRIKSHKSNSIKNFFQDKLTFSMSQKEVCSGMIPVDEVFKFDLNDDGYSITLNCGSIINVSSKKFSNREVSKLYFGSTAKLRQNKRYPEKLTLAEKSRSLYLIKERYIAPKSRGLKCFEIAEGVALNTMHFIRTHLNIPIANHNDFYATSKNKTNLISLRFLFNSMKSLKSVKLA